ncbi:MAG: hypothetical protein K2M50_06525 [Treponemataceae bacterium]|nr:hypothetical protein [Treponema sp.]MDE6245292.1 hypothetical protein [Treponemataceae bacterium]
MAKIVEALRLNTKRTIRREMSFAEDKATGVGDGGAVAEDALLFYV